MKGDVNADQGPLNPGVLSLVQFVLHKAVSSSPSPSKYVQHAGTQTISKRIVIRYLPGGDRSAAHWNNSETDTAMMKRTEGIYMNREQEACKTDYL